MRKEKTIFIVALSRFTVPSGICRYAFNLAKIVSGITGVSVTLVVGKWQERYYRESFDWEGLTIDLKIVAIPNNSLSRNFWFIFVLPFSVLRNKVDTLILSFPIPFFRILSPKLKVITSIHDLYAFEFPENFRYPFFNRLFTIISASNADFISALSIVTHKKIKQLLPRFADKTIVNYTPFAYKNTIGTANTMGEYILSVAQHRKNKNLDLLIKAYVMLRKEDKLQNKKLIIVGSEGPETNYLKELSVEYEDAILFRHGIADDELKNLYLNADCFVLLSSNEGLGIPLIESLYYCRYIISSDIEVFKEIDESNCNFVSLTENPIEQVAHYLVSELRPNTKFGIQDERFILKNIRKKYETLLN